MIFINILVATLVYSGLSSTLQITGNANFRVEADIRISGISFEVENGAQIQYEPTYSKNSITLGFLLPEENSKIKYKVKVNNNGEIDQTIYDFITKSTNNNDVICEPENYNEKDIIGFKDEIEIIIGCSSANPTSKVINYIMDFDYRKVYYLSYESSLGYNIPENQIKYEKENITISENNMEVIGYTFNGWEAEGVMYQPGSLYELEKDIILNANYEANTYKLTLDEQSPTTTGTQIIYEKYNQGIYLDSSLTKEMTTSNNAITLPTKTNHSFGGYYTEKNAKGTKIIGATGNITNEASSKMFTSDTVLYAKWYDTIVPTMKMTATKSSSGTEVNSNTWSSEGLNFNFELLSAGSSGATMYYCKDVNNTCDPNIEVETSSTITNYNTLGQNIYYIRYKVVSGDGLTSGITSYTAKVDGLQPTLTLLGSGTRELTSTESIVTSVTYGISGGSYKCINLSNSNATVTTLNSIDRLGNNQIRCTATSNSGVSSQAKEVYYKLSSNLDFSSPYIGVTNEGKIENNTIILPPNSTQFGPYINLTKGCYLVIYEGENINYAANNFKVVYGGWNGGTQVEIDILNLNYLPSTSNYYFQLDSNIDGLEVLLGNPSDSTVNITITKIRIEYAGETCSF